MMPMLRDMERIQNTDVEPSMAPRARGAIAMAKIHAGQGIPLIRSLLFPGDADG